MKALKSMFVMAVLGLALAPGGAWAQTPPATPPAQTPPAQPPAPQLPATQPPATQPPAAQPPAPFPEGAKVGLVIFQLIASQSAEGKAATARIDELRKKKTAELQDKQKKLQEQQTKLQQGGNVMSDSARSALEREIEKMQRDLQFANEDATKDVEELTEQLRGEFQQKLNPIIEQVAMEKGLQLVLAYPESGIVWAQGGLDLSQEVVKRLDAASKAPAKK
jgi:outer membrane protein